MTAHLMSVRTWIAPLVGFLAVGGTLLSSCAGSSSLPVAQSSREAPLNVLNGAALEPAVDLPALTFTHSDGAPFSTADTGDRLSLFFFGYTHCADVCPLTLAEFSQMRSELGPDARRVDMYFVTLDPARDTADRMRTYMAHFPGVVGLIGTDAELAAAQSAFGVISQRQDLGNGDYALDHTAATYLVNGDTQIQLVYPYGTSPDEIASDLQRLLQS